LYVGDVYSITITQIKAVMYTDYFLSHATREPAHNNGRGPLP